MEEVKLKGRIYIDANVFIAAALTLDKESESARAVLDDIRHGEAATSFITLDEVAYKIKKQRGTQAAVDYCRGMLNSGISFIEVDGRIATSALEAMLHLRLDPRDAFHYAAMKTLGISQIVSQDEDFDDIPGIKRISL